MSALKESPTEEENCKSMSKSSVDLMSDPAFSPRGEKVSEPPVQCPRENMTPNGDQADLLTHVSFIDPVCADGPAKASYVNGSASPNGSDEDLLDISKNVPGFLPNSLLSQNSPSTAGIQLEDCDLLQKDGEMTIRQVVTAEDVENQGIWGFDAESPENALEVYGNGNDLEWDPHKEFKNFLMDDRVQPKTEEKSPSPPPTNSRRRKRKMDMVVMVDPSEDDFTSFEFDSTNNHQGEGSHGMKDSKYSNGTTVAFKQGFPKPAKNRKTSQNNHLNQKPFICKECERSFFDHNSLLRHITIHQKKRPKIVEGVKEKEKIKNKGKDARLRCPQCPFGTDCPNDFVSHAQSHIKDKRYPCQKCNFKALNDIELMSHVIRKHPVTSAPTSVKGKQDGLQERKAGTSDKTTATSCRLKPRKANFVKNHVEILHKANLDKEERSTSPPERTSSAYQQSDDSTCPLQRERKKTKDAKMDKSESRLDKSIHTLLSRKMNCKQRTSRSNSDCNFDKMGAGCDGPDLRNSCNNDFIDLNATRTRKVVSPSKSKGGQFVLKEGNVFLNKPDRYGNVFQGAANDDGSEGEKSSVGEEPVSFVEATLKKSPSKRKMSTPFHNLQGQDILIDFPKCRQMFQKINVLNTNDAGDLGVSNHIDSTNLSHKKGSPWGSSDQSEDDLGSPEMTSIKEECEETEVCSETINPSSAVSNGKFQSPLKPCPYCPALFESGIGLSNHVRGHLHRVGVSYNARHAVSAAEVASHDKGHTVRRRAPAVPRVKTEVDLASIDHAQTVQPSEEKYELVCPLCREWFDSKTGLSNHVRGHLKRLGKPCSSSLTKSPVLILKEMMRDKKQFQAKLQAIEKKCRSRGSSYHFSLSNGVIVSTTKVQRFAQGGKRQALVSSQSVEEKKRTENDEDEMKESPSSDLIGLLKKRRAHEEARAKTQPQTARKALHVSPSKEGDPSASLPNSVSEKSDLNRKVCVHCNATFHSGVSLSNHLRAYARRKKNALLDGTTYDCKRKQRSRSGSKKKTHPLLQTPEEIYRLTCRFCDLVFQGPLSVQEDWVKHLQRHIMNTAVPHTGAAMVEVTTFPGDPNTHTPPETSL